MLRGSQIWGYESVIPFRDDTHMASTLKGWDKANTRGYQTSDVGGPGVSKCSGRPINIFVLNKIVFAP